MPRPVPRFTAETVRLDAEIRVVAREARKALAYAAVAPTAAEADVRFARFRELHARHVALRVQRDAT